ncbi:MAG: hypothetical protein ACRDYW_09340 [Acidimicrobiales bacterium]
MESLDDVPGGPTSGRHRAPGGWRGRWRLYLASAAVFVVIAAAGLMAPSLLDSDDGGSDPIFDVVDDFDRASAEGLGEDDGRAWEVVSGAFEIEDGDALVTSFNEDGPRTIAVTAVGATNGTITVEAGRVTPGWGVVFRFVGPFNYWYVQAVPEYAVLNVVRVVNGDAVVVGSTKLTKVTDGMEVTIELEGASIEVRMAGEPIFATTSDHGLGARKAGLVSVGESDGTSWSSFRVEANRQNPGPTTVKLVGDGPRSTTSSTAQDRTTTTLAPAEGAFG